METDASPPPLGGESEPSMSLVGRLFNIFATPGDVFEDIKARPPAFVNWLTPLIISCVVGVLATVVMFSQPRIIQQTREQQNKALEEQVTAGKMTRQQADQMEAMFEKFSSPTFLMLAGGAGVVFSSALMLFIAGLVVWVYGSALFKAPLDYHKALEVAGLASMVNVLASIVVTLLIVAQGKLVTGITPALFLDHYDPQNLSHAFLNLLNVMTLWYLAVLSIGLQKLTGKSFAKAAACIFGTWFVVSAAMITVSYLTVQLLGSLKHGH